MTRYAQGTSVSIYRSQEEISRILHRYGATDFTFGLKQTGAAIQFRLDHRTIRITLPFPDQTDPQFWCGPKGKKRRTENQAFTAYEQACRQCWRALALVVKAKLEAVAAGITTVEQEFLAHILLPNGKTVGQFIAPQIETAYSKRTMPPLLEFGGAQ